MKIKDLIDVLKLMTFNVQGKLYLDSKEIITPINTDIGKIVNNYRSVVIINDEYGYDILDQTPDFGCQNEKKKLFLKKYGNLEVIKCDMELRPFSNSKSETGDESKFIIYVKKEDFDSIKNEKEL